MRTLRVLYLLPAEGFGGAERQGVYHLKELPHHGVEVHAVAGPGEPIARALECSDVAYERFQHFPDRVHAPLTPFGSLRYAGEWLARLGRAASAIERRLQEDHFDLIFANRTAAWLVAASVSFRLGVPYVIRAGSRLAHPALGFGLPLLDLVAGPAAVFSNCQAVDRAIASRFRTVRYSLPNAVDEEEFYPGPSAPARARLGLPFGVALVGLAARPAPEKGFELFADVVARVRARRPDTCFVVAGEFGWRAHYESRFRAAGLADAVRFLGHVDAMRDFYRAVDVVVLTSPERSIEASPNALLEAMATGRPIVATAVGGVPELFEQGREGYLTGEHDAAGFAERVLELLDAPDRREALGRAGRMRAVSRHRVGAVVAALARDLRAVASASVRGHRPDHGTFAGLVRPGE